MIREDAVATGSAQGPGPFITYRVSRLESGLLRVATSRRHRKGLPPHEVEDLAHATRPPDTPASAFLHVFAPGRLGWWIAVLFAVGAACFVAGGLAATWPGEAPTALHGAPTLAWLFFMGSLFFTSAAWLQWLEALNANVADALETAAPSWRWLGWCPRNLGYLACTVQLAGTVLFNFDTADALIPRLGWREQDLLIWTPDMLGSICFLVASSLAFAEVSHGAAIFAPRSVSWWIAIVNLLGSVAFQISAILGFVPPGPGSPERLFASTLMTATGAFCFLVGAYLLIPELFDTHSPPHTRTPAQRGTNPHQRQGLRER